MKPSYILLTIAGSALSLSGQKTFSGPAGAYVFDGSGHSVRAVLGVPGAAYLGSPTQPAWDLVSVAPNGKWALGVNGLSVNRISDPSQPASFSLLVQAPGPIARIAWSGDSTTAAIWSPQAGQLQRITGLDSTPSAHAPIDLSGIGGLLSGWSLSPDGHDLALASSASQVSSVYISDQDAVPVAIGSVAKPGAVAFSADGASLFVFSSAARQILRLSLPSGAIAGRFDASAFVFVEEAAPEGPGIRESRRGRRPDAPVVQDLAASADGARLYAIGAETLCGYEVSTGQTLSCNQLGISPTSFQPVPGGILLMDYPRAEGAPLWLLDTRAGQVYFVPAGSASTDASF
jgi:hypothetical protein